MTFKNNKYKHMKNILIINAHPDKESFCSNLAISYKEGADKAGGNCKLINLIDLKFSPVLKYGYRKQTELEPDLLKAQSDIVSANHLVFVFPVWWGTYPALLKGFIDRVFLPGFAFEYKENSLLWDKKLTGKTARIIFTMNTPKWYNRFVYKRPAYYSLKKSVLEFCGISPVKITSLSPIKTSDALKREKWLGEVKKLGEKQK